MSLKVDDSGYTRVDPQGGPVTVCLEPKRDEFMKHFSVRSAGSSVTNDGNLRTAAEALRASRRWFSDSAPHAKTPPRTNQLSVNAKITA